MLNSEKEAFLQSALPELCVAVLGAQGARLLSFLHEVQGERSSRVDDLFGCLDTSSKTPTNQRDRQQTEL